MNVSVTWLAIRSLNIHESLLNHLLDLYNPMCIISNNLPQLFDLASDLGVVSDYPELTKIAHNLVRTEKFARLGEKLKFSKNWFLGFKKIWCKTDQEFSPTL